jgi:hypothetical protein
MGIRCLPNILRNFLECFTIIDDLFHFIFESYINDFFDLMSFFFKLKFPPIIGDTSMTFDHTKLV